MARVSLPDGLIGVSAMTLLDRIGAGFPSTLKMGARGDARYGQPSLADWDSWIRLGIEDFPPEGVVEMLPSRDGYVPVLRMSMELMPGGRRAMTVRHTEESDDPEKYRVLAPRPFTAEEVFGAPELLEAFEDVARDYEVNQISLEWIRPTADVGRSRELQAFLTSNGYEGQIEPMRPGEVLTPLGYREAVEQTPSPVAGVLFRFVKCL